ncbi:DNA repair protein RadA [Candidatus Marinamargulisbacteria bacterium SCGC AG-343-D04]|nr:DNA repair protein RadA [Candidatus Marinamargulisbacteria bacterium SCGC AG-343-D04]
MAPKVITRYECQSCGASYLKWLGQCEKCDNWNTLVEIREEKTASRKHHVKKAIKSEKLQEVQQEDISFYPTRMRELDTVLGQGLVKGSVVLLGGEPGVGKSTLSLQIAQQCATLQHKVLYVSAEESASQIKIRAERLGLLPELVWVYSQTNMLSIIKECEVIDPDIIILDSIQVVFHPELTAIEGTVSQVRQCASTLINWIKENNKSAIMIGHITKEGQIAGPKTLEHLVDVILYLEGDRHHQHRILRCQKNRYGSTDNIGMFEMKKVGLLPLEDPSQCFRQDKDNAMSGSAITPYSEGGRILLVEVQALAVESGYGMAKRNFVGVSPHRANVLIAALDKLVKLRLAAHDIFVSLIGGLRVTDPSIDCAIIVAIVSSLKQVPIDDRWGICGEVGLTGEVRPIPHCEKRVKELKKHGFKACIVPKKNKSPQLEKENFEIHYVSHIIEVMRLLF